MFLPAAFSSSRSAVLDCGASRTSLGVFRCKQGRLRLDHFLSHALSAEPAGENSWLDHTLAAFSALAAKTKASGPAVLVLPGHATLAKLIRIPRVDPAQREKIIRFEAAQAIPYALAEVVWDRIVVHETPSELEVLLVAAKLDRVEALCAGATNAGFRIGSVVPSWLATLAAFRGLPPDKTVSSLVLNIGARSTTVLLVDEHRFALRTLAFGADGCGVAPHVSQETGTPDQGTPARPEVRLLREIVRTLLHFQWSSAMSKPDRVYLVGGGSRLPGLVEGLEIKLKIPADRIRPLSLAGVIDGDSGTDDPAGVDTCGAALLTGGGHLSPGGSTPSPGWAKPENADDRKQIAFNLLPPVRQRSLTNGRSHRWLAAAAVLATAIAIPPLVHFHLLRSEMEKKIGAVERELAPLRARDGRIREKQRRLDALRQQGVLLADLRGRRFTWLALLADLDERLGRVEDVWFDKMQLLPEPLTGPPRLAVSGRMVDRANPSLNASPQALLRVKVLLASLVESPFVELIEGEHFEGGQPGVLKFDFVLVGEAKRPL